MMDNALAFAKWVERQSMLRCDFFRINDTEHHLQLVCVRAPEWETLNNWSYCFLVKRCSFFSLSFPLFYGRKIARCPLVQVYQKNSKGAKTFLTDANTTAWEQTACKLLEKNGLF
ncbi:hypothetical protein CEXT_264271 [Caerostris extrusa]|uniref:Uncharacterized protein n=1 Tax=Caerostris extrusa TaxID=172846 RepID=A0AAV4PZH1_CAEEX|nr:hypothetical protein CEXT_264271 [Caerostris extrusa]